MKAVPKPRRNNGRGQAATVEPEPTVVRMMREFQELARQMAPPEEWAKIPPDFLDNLDHYLYGAPKKPAKR